MKLVIALIPTGNLSLVQDALHQICAGPTTAAEVLDCDSTDGPMEVYRGRAVRRPVSRVRLEVVVEDESLKTAVDAILRAGGRRVFVMVLDQCAAVGG